MSNSFTREYYIEYIKLMLGGGVLILEVPDEILGKYVDAALQELQRFIDQSVYITVPFAKCIDLTGFNHSAILHVYRTEGFTGDTTSAMTSSEVDPMYAQTWAVFSGGGTMYNLKNYVMNYLSYNTLLQMRNTMSTDLIFREDKSANKLYINASYDQPTKITIEYIPVYKSVEEITSDYWIDILKRLSLAMVKIALGRIRTYAKQSNALYQIDGDTLLQEGNQELSELRELLRSNANLMFPLD